MKTTCVDNPEPEIFLKFIALEFFRAISFALFSRRGWNRFTLGLNFTVEKELVLYSFSAKR